ncbi:CRISPR-associated endonuclease Cas1 [Brevibacillus parabrevis]|uniref:CRISPR-associated endonuclease Cas4g/Cas1g n=2 Tax=Brevibacillus parabrevis TaxID=54914 RepID=UPI001C22C96C|nr:CRISPR-associated endonuclease Cas1 [Brevibacillus parabrevis]MBU8712521.1 CRISPR-associated endonuclease Cas1 [Brevibacillus parabrevis]
MSWIPVRMLNEIQYCERLYHIMHVQGLFEESADTIEGAAQHRRAETNLRKNKMAPEELWGEAPSSLNLGDPVLGITGKLDAVCVEQGNQWIPVEGKHSSAPDGGHTFSVGEYELDGSAWPNDQIQLCAQGLLLRSNGYESDYGYLYYRGNKKKVQIEFSQDLISVTRRFIEKAQALKDADMPPPLQDSKKCFRCSLNYVCMPDETNYLTGVSANIRKIVPSRPDGGMLYVAEPGATLGRSGECLTITLKGEKLDEIPIKDLVHVSLMGNVQCSTQLMHTLMNCGIHVSYLTTHGTLAGITSPPLTKNIRTRVKQFGAFQEPPVALALTRRVIYAKISNQRTMLRRNGSPEKSVLKELKELRERVLGAESLDMARGIEGRAAQLYMQSFPTMLAEPMVDGIAMMNGRNRRPPKDPVNALLSLGYTLLSRDVYTACVNVGLDPLFGFFHAMEAGRPALALDLMEPYRALIADSVAIRALNTKELTPDDFYWGKDSCYLKKGGRQKYFSAYERRLNEAMTHPQFGYKLSYRRMLELEARFLARYLDGELAEYTPLMTR